MNQEKLRLFKVVGMSVLVVLAAIGALAILVFMLSTNPTRRGNEVVLHGDSSTVSDKQPSVRFSLPQRIFGTRYSRCDVLLVDPDAKSRFQEIGSYSSRSGDEYGSMVNVAIFDVETNEYRLVFSRPALLRDINRSHRESDTLQPVLLYEAYVNDTNGDGLLGSKDNLTLFASDLDGKNLVQITPDSVSLSEWEFADDYLKLTISVKQRADPSSPGERQVMRQLLWYDLKHRVLYSQPALDRLLEQAKRVMLH
jgi:hypothetical protein